MIRRNINGQPKKGKPLAPDARDALQRLVADEGVRVAEEIGICVPTLTRALAGLEVYGATNGAIRGYLFRRSAA